MKWMIAVLAAVIVALVVVACGGSASDEQNGAQTPSLAVCGSYAQYYGTVEEIARKTAEVGGMESSEFRINIERERGEERFYYTAGITINYSSKAFDSVRGFGFDYDSLSVAMCEALEEVKFQLNIHTLSVQENALAGSVYKDALEIAAKANQGQDFEFDFDVFVGGSLGDDVEISFHLRAPHLGPQYSPTGISGHIDGEGASLQEAADNFYANVRERLGTEFIP